MDAATWAHVRAAFESALALPEAERAAWLDANCPDPALREQVQALLNNAGGDTPWPRAEALGPLISPVPPDQVGAWRLVECIGHGGMGEVWRAVRADGAFDGQAAVKLLRPGLEAEGLAQRFAQEQQALAQMQHPHISRLLDAGLSADGRPFLVMEFVAGRPIDEALQGAPQRRVIDTFLQLAQAVAHAHRKLFVHRDIKPSNVLVDGHGEVKLLDFGIAKALDPLQSRGDATLFAQRPFTPAYASPEQVRGEPISTATDVYSLGVLLYRLLTGQAPYGRSATTAADQARAVLDEAPQTLGLPPDLAQVLQKAMRKQPDERYPSVEALADDLGRYQRGYPVRARPVGAVERALKFVRRHPLGSAASSLAVLAVLGASSVALWQAHRAEQQLLSLKQLTRGIVFKFGDAVTYIPGGMAIKADLLAQSVQALDAFSDLSADDPDVRAQAAMAYSRLADIEFSDTSASLQRREQAQQHADKALRLGASVVEQRLREAEFVIWYIRALESAARTERAQGRAAAGLAKLEPVLPLLERAVAVADPKAGEDRLALVVEQARARHLRSQFFYKPGGAHLDRPADALADLAEARKTLLALEQAKHHPELVYLLGSVDGAEALVLLGLDRIPEAVTLGRAALVRRESVVLELPEDVEYRDALVTEAVNLGKILLRTPDTAAALAATARGWGMNEQLRLEQADPEHNAWARRRPVLAHWHAKALLASGRQAEAAAVVAQGLASGPTPEQRQALDALQPAR